MSNLSAIEYVTSPSALTTGLFNQRLSTISANFAALNSDVTIGVGSGTTVSIQTNLNVVGGAHFQFISVGSTPPSYVTTAAITVEVNSAFSDYMYFVDSSAQKSSYIIGSRAGGLADGLNIWDASAGTMIASFSKQSIRFFQTVVGPVFDVGGALASTYNAATFIGSGSSLSGIQAAINQASIDGISRVYVPASMYPYSASSISFIYTVQMVREGGDWSHWDVVAYGAAGDGVRADTAAIQSAMNARAGAGGGTVWFPGQHRITSTLTVPSDVPVTLQGTGIGDVNTGLGGSWLKRDSAFTVGPMLVQSGNFLVSGYHRVGMRMYDLLLDNSQVSQPIIYWDGVFNHVRFANVIMRNSGAEALKCRVIENATFLECNFYGCGDSAQSKAVVLMDAHPTIAGTANITVDFIDCQFELNNGDDIVIDNPSMAGGFGAAGVEIIGGKFEHGSTGVQIHRNIVLRAGVDVTVHTQCSCGASGASAAAVVFEAPSNGGTGSAYAEIDVLYDNDSSTAALNPTYVFDVQVAKNVLIRGSSHHGAANGGAIININNTTADGIRVDPNFIYSVVLPGGSTISGENVGPNSFATDRGDTNATLVAGRNAETQLFATTLTANRTITLAKISGDLAFQPWRGAKFHVVRTGLGAFTMTMINGSGGAALKVFPISTAASGTFEFDGANWNLTRYGVL